MNARRLLLGTVATLLLLAPAALAATASDCSPTATVTGTAMVCPNSLGVITVDLTGVPPWTVGWNDGFFEDNIAYSPYQRFVSPSSEPYSITLLSDAFCGGTGTGSATVTETPEPTATLSGSKTVCKGNPAEIKIVLTGSGPWNLYWNDGYRQLNVITPAVTRTVTPSATTMYSVMTLGDAYCQTQPMSSAVLITVAPGTAPSFASVQNSTTVLYGKRAVLSPAISGSGPFIAQWYEGPARDASHPIAGATGLTFETPPITSTRTYWVSVSNGCGLAESATMTVDYAAPKRRAVR